MEAHVRKSRNIRLRIVEVGSWDSDVAEQFEIRRLPTLHLYDGDTLLSDDTQTVLELIQR